MLDRFEKALKKKLTDYEEDPAPALWEEIKPNLRYAPPSGWMDATEIFSLVTLVVMLSWISVSNPFFTGEAPQYSAILKNVVAPPMDSLSERTSSNSKAKENSRPSVTDLNQTNQRANRTSPIVINQPHGADSTHTSKRTGYVQNTIPQHTTDVVALHKLTDISVNASRSMNNTKSSTEVIHNESNAHQTQRASANYSLFDHRLSFTKVEIEKPMWKEFIFDKKSTVVASAKKDSSQQKQHSSFLKGALYIQATPVLSYQRVISNTRDSQYINDLQSLPALSPKRIGLRLESGWEWDATERIKIGVGAVYFQRKQELRYTTQSIERMEIQETAPGALVLAPVLTTENHVLEFETKSVGIGAQVTYQVTQNRWRNYAGGGIDYQYSLTRTASSDQLTEPTHYVFVNLFYRVTYPATPHITLFVQPTLNYTTNFTNTFTSALYAKPYGVGLGLGAMLKIKTRANKE